MCGIAGALTNHPIQEKAINHCLNILNHRGPDAQNHLQFKIKENLYLTLLHTRLSIVDLPSSNQPFKSCNGILSYNGEIYNYKELRHKLQQSNSERFNTSGDTEVLAKMLDNFGISGLEHCDGMWSFAYYNKLASELILAVDRFGEKPLYCSKSSDGIFFGSTPRSVSILSGITLKPNVTKLSHFLVNGYKDIFKQGGSFYKGIEKLDNGSCICVDQNLNIKDIKWWVPKLRQSCLSPFDYKKSTNDIKELLIRSVETRHHADVPVAYCLSGGIDSNALVGIASKALGYKVNAFTVTSSCSDYGESSLVDISVKTNNINHKYVSPSFDIFTSLKDLIHSTEAPVFTINYLAHSRLLNEVSEQGYKVTVSGTGADELFSGYYDHHLYYLSCLHESGSSLYAKAKEDWHNIILPNIRNPYFRDLKTFLTEPSCRHLFQFNSSRRVSLLKTPISAPFEESYYNENLLKNRMLNELFHEITPVILMQDDLNSMNVSVENRSPFLQPDLLNYLIQFPYQYFIKDGLAKNILRDAVSEFVDPQINYNSRKIGFNFPLCKYINFDRPNDIKTFLQDSPLFDLLDYDSFKDYLNDFDFSSAEDCKFLFSALSIKYFLEDNL